MARVEAHAGRAQRCSQARSSGAAFMSVGNTRPEVPTKVSMPRPAAHARTAAPSNASTASRRLAALAIALQQGARWAPNA
jgi:hypothetical protein